MENQTIILDKGKVKELFGRPPNYKLNVSNDVDWNYHSPDPYWDPDLEKFIPLRIEFINGKVKNVKCVDV